MATTPHMLFSRQGVFPPRADEAVDDGNALTQLAQFGGRFHDFVQGAVSQVKWLEGGRGGFERVVPTLAIDE